MPDNMITFRNSQVQALNENVRQMYENIADRAFTVDDFNIKLPTVCPICGWAINVLNDCYLNWHDMYSQSESFNVISIYHCPHCHKGFVVMHHMNMGDNEYVEISQSLYPDMYCDVLIDERVQQISPRFYEIYRQCLIAKNKNLDQIYGMGFRKALEQLVTDFIIWQYPDDKEKILKMSLHNRIEQYFSESDENPILMACKQLGNNEAHYENYNTVEDLQSCETLIEDIVGYVKHKVVYKEAERINSENKGKY